MARLIDLEEEGQIDPDAARDGPTKDDPGEIPQPTTTLDANQVYENVGLFSGALFCYPIASQLARYLDLNSLHELSRTCRLIRAILLQYRTHLIRKTLRCVFEADDPTQRHGTALHTSHEVWTTYGANGARIGRITSGKVGACVRDMVGGCRRCNRQVCRNCIMKIPPTSTFKGRHRRLCRTCMKSSLERLTTTPQHYTFSLFPQSNPNADIDAPTITRSPCSCEQSVWICHPCGQTLRTADTTYARGWAWRTRYSACGGIGAGLGEGNEGVECGRSGSSSTRQTACLAAREVEHEIEYDVDDFPAREQDYVNLEATSTSSHHWVGSSYTMHEIVGIGGRVKKKLRKIVSVGAIVKEYEDERATGSFLAREQNGTNRSWCSWCSRVVPSHKDREQMKSGHTNTS